MDPRPIPSASPTLVARNCWRELEEYNKSYGLIGMCLMALKKLIQEQDSNYHIKKILEIIREGAHAIWKERTRVHALFFFFFFIV